MKPLTHPRIAIIGLGFGAEFIPIYQRHPNATMEAICQRNPDTLKQVGEKFGIAKRYTSYEELLKDPEVDAVHINTPIPDHAAHTLQALRAGKHVACTVPMATSVEDCKAIVDLCAQTGLKYMMMETVVYAREFLFMRQLFQEGRLGKLQFLKASHQQDMDGWPGYWPGLPPMHYATHCVGPVLGLGRNQAQYVSCFGSGTIREEMHGCYGSPYAVETTHIKFKDSDLSAQVYRSLFDVARQYRESIEVYGSKQSVEWPLVEHGKLVVHTAKSRSRRFPRKWNARTLRIFCLRRLPHSPGAGCIPTTRGKSTSASRRGAGMAARIPTWCTSLWNCFGAVERDIQTRFSRRTSR